MKRMTITFASLALILLFLTWSAVPHASSKSLRKAAENGGVISLSERAENEDPDLPPGAQGIDKETYLRMRGEYIARLRGFEPDKPFSTVVRSRAIQQMNAQEEALREEAKSGGPRIVKQEALAWTPIGPNPIPNGQINGIPNFFGVAATGLPVTGRATAIAVKPTDPNIVYLGTAQGGLYRSTDGGTNWTPLMDTAQSLAIGAIAIAPSQTTTVFVGTGEANNCGDCYAGVGIYRITNAESASPTIAGPFETRTGSAATTHAFLNTSISKIVVDKDNPDRIFVGNALGFGGIGQHFFDGGADSAFTGLYLSTNATQASPTFIRVTGLPGTGLGTVQDIVFEPGSSTNLLVGQGNAGGDATLAGIFRSTNANTGAPTFTKTLTLTDTNFTTNFKFAIHRNGDTVTVFAATSETDTSASQCLTSGAATEGVVRKSTNGGQTWSNPIPSANGFCGTQCLYDIAIAMDPADANKVYLGGAFSSGGCSRTFSKSANGANADASTITFTQSDNNTHADSHALFVAPSLTSVLYFANDGGIFKSLDSGTTWASANTSGLNTIQFQSAAAHPTDQNYTIGGTQDNGTELRQTDGTWTRSRGGDGGFTLIDQNSTDAVNVTMYHTFFFLKNIQIGYERADTTAQATTNSWTSIGCFRNTSANNINCSDDTLFYAPMALGPGNPNTVYLGTDRLYRSADKGSTHTIVSQQPIVAGVPISAIGISRQNDNVRIVGLQNGQVYVTTIGSTALTDVTGASLPACYVARAVIDPTNVNTAYVTFSCFGTTAAPIQHVWRSTNLNNATPTWKAINGTGTNILPDIPVNVFLVDPLNSTHLYAGTDIGVYVSTDSGANWSPFGSGLPRVAVFDMAMARANQSSNRVLRIATHGRGMWENTPVSPTAAGAEISGRVTNPDGSPLAGVLMSLSGARSATAITDSDGRFSFDDVEAGSF